MRYFLGIDGGGTRTTAWLADEQGRVLARALTGPSNPLKVGFDAAQRELLRAARLTIRRARLKAQNLHAVCVGLAGVDRPPVHRRLLAWLRKFIPAHHHCLTSDAAIALQAALGDSAGIVVISGTGSIAYARDERGRVSRSGGWGVPFDDTGSGYDLGRKAIMAALRDLDGRGEPTILGRRIRRALGLPELALVVLKPLTPQKIASLFPLVLEAARRGDFVAQRLLEEAGHDLGELALALVERLGWKRRALTVVCAGGVFSSSRRIRQMFAHCVRAVAPRARVLLLGRPAVEGALALARKLATAAKQ